MQQPQDKQMKITRKQLRQIIKEEVIIIEADGADPDRDADIDADGPADLPWLGTGTAPWKTNAADTPAKALALAILKELGVITPTFKPENVIALLNKLGYDIVKTTSE